MSKKARVPDQEPNPETDSIRFITVSGYKSIRDEQSIEIKPLTILAGANSSGKSSMIQPLLLLKQTLEAPYDPGPLLLNGPNVKFTSADQLLSRGIDTFHVGVSLESGVALTTYFTRQENNAFQLKKMTYN